MYLFAKEAGASNPLASSNLAVSAKVFAKQKSFAEASKQAALLACEIRKTFLCFVYKTRKVPAAVSANLTASAKKTPPFTWGFSLFNAKI